MAQSAIRSFEPTTARTKAAWTSKDVMRQRFHVPLGVARRKSRHGASRVVLLLLAVHALLLALALHACSPRLGDSQGEPVRPGPAGGGDLEGLEFRGELFSLESFPVQLIANVTVTNTSDHRRDVEFPDGCVVLLRAYRGDRRVWDQAGSRACAMAIQSVTLEAGESETFRSGTASAYEVLADRLPDGRYRMAAYLRPGGTSVELDLGVVELAVPRD